MDDMDDFDSTVIADGLFAGFLDSDDVVDTVTVCPRMQDSVDDLAAKVRAAARDTEIKRVENLFADLCTYAKSLDPEILDRALAKLAERETAAKRMSV